MFMTHLAHDRRASKSALRNCSLTCRAWLPPSRARIFEKVDLEKRAHIHSFYEILRPSHYLGSYVRTFGLSFIQEDLRVDEGDIVLTGEEISILQSTLPALQCVQRLNFSSIFMVWPAALQVPLMDHVTTLCVAVYFPGAEHFAFLLTCVPNVERIIVRDPETVSSGSPINSLPKPADPMPVLAPKLHSVTLRGVCQATTLFPLFSLSPQLLLIGFSCIADVEMFCAAFRYSNAAASLARLSLTFHGDDPSPGKCPA